MLGVSPNIKKPKRHKSKSMGIRSIAGICGNNGTKKIMLEGWKGTHRPVIIQTIKSFIGATPDKKKLNLKNLNKKVRRGPTSGRHFQPKKIYKNKRQI